MLQGLWHAVRHRCDVQVEVLVSLAFSFLSERVPAVIGVQNWLRSTVAMDEADGDEMRDVCLLCRRVTEWDYHGRLIMLATATGWSTDATCSSPGHSESHSTVAQAPTSHLSATRLVVAHFTPDSRSCPWPCPAFAYYRSCQPDSNLNGIGAPYLKLTTTLAFSKTAPCHVMILKRALLHRHGNSTTKVTGVSFLPLQTRWPNRHVFFLTKSFLATS